MTTAKEANKVKGHQARSNISLEALYNTMSVEAGGLYNQAITICTAFLGGTLIFYERLFVSDITWTLIILVLGWITLVYPLAAFTYVRWQNVEAHRHVLEYFNTGEKEDYDKALAIPKKSRCLTKSAITSMVIGLCLVGIFTTLNLVLLQKEIKMNEKKDTPAQNEKESNDQSSEIQQDRNLKPGQTVQGSPEKPSQQESPAIDEKKSIDPSSVIVPDHPIIHPEPNQPSDDETPQLDSPTKIQKLSLDPTSIIKVKPDTEPQEEPPVETPNEED